jgi:hypothetical protein
MTAKQTTITIKAMHKAALQHLNAVKGGTGAREARAKVKALREVLIAIGVPENQIA